MKTQTATLLEEILRSDREISVSQIKAAIGFLNRNSEPANDPTRYVDYPTATRLLGVKRLTVEKLIQRGKLERAYIPGRKYAIGVTRASFRKLTERRMPYGNCPSPFISREGGASNRSSRPLRAYPASSARAERGT